MKTKNRLFVFAILATMIGGNYALACHRCDRAIKHVKHRYDARFAQLKAQVDAEREAIVCAKRDALKRLTLERKAANRLCGAERKFALREIQAARKSVLETYRRDLDALRQYHRNTLAQIRNSYEVVVARVPATYCMQVQPVFVEVASCSTAPSPSVRVSPELGWTQPTDNFDDDWRVVEPESVVPPDDSDWEIIEDGPVFPSPAESLPSPPQVIGPQSSFQYPNSSSRIRVRQSELERSAGLIPARSWNRSSSKTTIKVAERERFSDSDFRRPLLALLGQWLAE